MSLKAISALILDATAAGKALLTAASAAAQRTALGLGTLATQSGTFSGTSSGTNTGDQTTVSGNAGSATVLATARTINGVSFDGSTNITVTAAGSTLSDTVTVSKGGTGLTALGSALQTIRVNADGTALEYVDASGLSGTGSVDNAVLRADGTGGATLQSSAIVFDDLYTASPNSTVNYVAMRPTGGTTNVGVAIVPKGTGAFSLAVPDGTTTGGTVRGANAVDLQTLRSTASSVASGVGSFAAGVSNTASGSSAVALGIGNTASGANSVAIGNFAIASGIYSNAFSRAWATGTDTFAHGFYALADRPGQYSHANGRFAAVGDGQFSRFVLRATTTNATPQTVLLGTHYSFVPSVRLTVPSGKIFFADVLVAGIKSDGSASACYKRKVAIKNVGGTASLVGSVETIGTDHEDNASTDVTITADNTNDALQIDVTGIASETWRWVAVVEGLEIAYGT